MSVRCRLGIGLCTAAFTMLAASPAAALELRHGLALQGGLGHWNEPSDGVAGGEYRWQPTFGAGWFVEAAVTRSLRVSGSLGWRRVGDEVRWSTDWVGTDHDSRIRLGVDQLALPAHVEYALPFAPAFSLEVGAQPEYVLKVMEKVELPALPSIRARQPYAQIFEDISKPFEVTSYARRLGGSATAGAAWRTRVFARDAALAMRYEHGLGDLWKDADTGLVRRARRVSGELRVAW